MVSSEKIAHLHFGHSGHATDENDLANVSLGDLCVLHGLVAGLDCLLDQVAHNLLKLCSAKKKL